MCQRGNASGGCNRVCAVRRVQLSAAPKGAAESWVLAVDATAGGW